MSDMPDVGYPLFVEHNECLKDWTDQCIPHWNLSQDSLMLCVCPTMCGGGSSGYVPWFTIFRTRSQVQFYCADIASILGALSTAREIYHMSGAQFSLK